MSSPAAVLVDFGTTRVKAACYDLQRDSIGQTIECAAPAAHCGQAGEVEADPWKYRDALVATAGALCERAGDAVRSVWLCSEMHGFLLDDGKGRPLTSYISWRDQRATRSAKHEPATIEKLEESAQLDFQQVTGMKLRSGLPCLTLAHLARSGCVPKDARFLSLPEWIAVAAGEFHCKVHESMAAASGLYDIEKHQWSDVIASAFGLAELRLQFSAVERTVGDPIGAVRLAGRTFPLLGAVGDMQAAMLGMGVPSRAAIGVNLGTGSQVARAVADAPGLHRERRPFFHGKLLFAVTHIPAGRALNVFAGFLDSAAIEAGGRQGVFWDLLERQTPQSILAAPLKADINVFDAAWHFGCGGAIGGILEGNLTVESLVASLAHAWLAQYAEAIALLDPNSQVDCVALGGGLARKIPAVREILRELCEREFLYPSTEEETIAGLARLAQSNWREMEPNKSWT